MDDDEELTAWHEAGHALMAVVRGGRIVHVSIEPENDLGPLRFGESIVQWPPSPRSQIELSEIHVSLAGPVAEMIYAGDQQPVAEVPEFADDWQRCVDNVRALTSDLESQWRMLTRAQEWLHHFFDQEHCWAAVSAIADELLTHETIEHDCVSEIVRFWKVG